ncbi:SMP-30/gluconolactonase/LRE family protein [Streptosporangiaceae bacterium NEAU-GS5]|nr:SMP-30/gluconolactonase/LRE family protein [Streptosporangiaceae bacterium NEAU-GS5]
MSPMVEIALRSHAKIGEGPTWDPRTGELVWVDILNSEIHFYRPATGEDRVQRVDQHVGAAKLRESGGLVLNMVGGVALLDSDGGFRWLADLGRDGVRGNDAAVDRQGRLWAGTMRYDQARGGGRLYRVDPDGTVATILDDVTISNGIDWSPEDTRMYYADTPTGKVDVFDVRDGTVVNRRTFVTIDRGSPDGLTVDAEGCIWLALWGAGAVHRYTPDGRLDRVIPIPASRVTACAFGGADLTDLYVTSAHADGEDLSGALFVVPDAGVGRPPGYFAG